VDIGQLEPDRIRTPGIYVQRVVMVEKVKVPISID
jgi:acyl CoA:acetate/3-ketoacid CoA transferase alpha subunit